MRSGVYIGQGGKEGLGGESVRCQSYSSLNRLMADLLCRTCHMNALMIQYLKGTFAQCRSRNGDGIAVVRWRRSGYR